MEGLLMVRLPLTARPGAGGGGAAGAGAQGWAGQAVAWADKISRSRIRTSVSR
jgi:hypothetical protein